MLVLKLRFACRSLRSALFFSSDPQISLRGHAEPRLFGEVFLYSYGIDPSVGSEPSGSWSGEAAISGWGFIGIEEEKLEA